VGAIRQRNLKAISLSVCECRENPCTERHILPSRVKEILFRFLHYSCNLDNIQQEGPQRVITWEFYENQCSRRHILRIGVIQKVAQTFYIFVRFAEKSVEVVHRCSLSDSEFRKIRHSEIRALLSGLNKFISVIPHLFQILVTFGLTDQLSILSIVKIGAGNAILLIVISEITFKHIFNVRTPW
jgi:hypothetical protein